MPSVSLLPPTRDFTLCCVTDRKALSGAADEQLRLLLEKIEAAGHAGVDWIQIREKDLSGRVLMELVRDAIRRVPPNCRVVVNDRLDVACAVGAAGVHLGEQSLPVPEAKRLVAERNIGSDFLLGISTHSLQAAQTAQANGADYIIFGPVFPTPSKLAYGLPQGVEKLAEVCRRVLIPVLAIGGITPLNAQQCMKAGASGIAAIRLFQDAKDVHALLATLHQL
jgi:thiamine-phosphate pyrophosphorylase